MNALQAVRRRWHPWYQLRKAPLFQHVVRVADVPIWVKLYGVTHPVQLHFIRNMTYWLMRGVLEPEVVALFLAINRTFTPKVFWDVGAHIGYYSWLLKSQNRQVDVTMFEPDPINVDMLRSTMRRAGDGMRVLPYAISDEEGRAPFALDVISGATGTLEDGEKAFMARHYGFRPRYTCVDTISLDKVREGSPRVNFIKIDVEGHEEAVFRGAQRMLAKDRPVVIFEVTCPNSPVLDVVRDLGYKVLSVDRMVEDPRGADNILGLPSERAGELEELIAQWKRELKPLLGRRSVHQ